MKCHTLNYHHLEYLERDIRSLPKYLIPAYSPIYLRLVYRGNDIHSLPSKRQKKQNTPAYLPGCLPLLYQGVGTHLLQKLKHEEGLYGTMDGNPNIH